MRHCPDCGRTWSSRHDVCPDCWELTSGNPPEPGERLRLVFQTHTLYEAEMIEALFRNEGIPCLKIPGPGNLLWPLGAPSPLALTRIYVNSRNLPLAQELIQEVTGGEATDA